MATSRTGTARWKNLRLTVLRQAQQSGQTHCPICRTVLDYHRGRHRASAEVDHIVPVAIGGADTRENCRVICRQCNQSLGGTHGARKRPRRRRTPIRNLDLDAAGRW